MSTADIPEGLFQVTPREATLFDVDCGYVVANASLKTLPGIVALVVCSIQQPFAHMPQQTADVAKNGSRSRFLFGHKREAFEYAREYRKEIWRAIEAYRDAPNHPQSLTRLVHKFCEIPGIGIVKGSFLAQLTVGDGACLDTLNIQWMGMHPRAFDVRKDRWRSLAKRIQSYNAVWRAHGDSAFWWDTWCERLSGRTHIDTGKRDAIGEPIMRRVPAIGSPEEVSAIHRLAIDAGVK